MNSSVEKLATNVWLVLLQRLAAFLIVPVVVFASLQFMAMRDSLAALLNDMQTIRATVAEHRADTILRLDRQESALNAERALSAARTEQLRAEIVARIIADERQDGQIAAMQAAVLGRLTAIEQRLSDYMQSIRSQGRSSAP